MSMRTSGLAIVSSYSDIELTKYTPERHGTSTQGQTHGSCLPGAAYAPWETPGAVGWKHTRKAPRQLGIAHTWAPDGHISPFLLYSAHTCSRANARLVLSLQESRHRGGDRSFTHATCLRGGALLLLLSAWHRKNPSK